MMMRVHAGYTTVCIKNFIKSGVFYMNFVTKIYVLGIMSKQNNCSLYCFLNQELCRVLCDEAKPRFASFCFHRRNCHKSFTQWNSIVTENVDYEENNVRNKQSIFKYYINYLVAHAHIHTRTNTHNSQDHRCPDMDWIINTVWGSHRRTSNFCGAVSGDWRGSRPQHRESYPLAPIPVASTGPVKNYWFVIFIKNLMDNKTNFT